MPVSPAKARHPRRRSIERLPGSVELSSSWVSYSLSGRRIPDMTTEPRITISRIAAEAGVSVPTVSKVVNGHPDVAEGTRARVEELIRKYGYRRRADERSRRSRL